MLPRLRETLQQQKTYIIHMKIGFKKILRRSKNPNLQR